MGQIFHQLSLKVVGQKRFWGFLFYIFASYVYCLYIDSYTVHMCYEMTHAVSFR